MHDQPKYLPLRASTFFGDERSARPVLAGTVARGQLRDDPMLYTGKDGGGADVTVFPLAVDARAMARGHERYNIFCSPCHGGTGEGDGMVVHRGYRRPPSLHQDRLRDAPVGISSASSRTASVQCRTASPIKAEDRWAIIAYVRALQLSEHATLADVRPPNEISMAAEPLAATADSPAGPGGIQRRLLIAGARAQSYRRSARS
jgi:hypothetical protein